MRDGTHDTPKYVPQGFPLVTSKNLLGGTLNLNNIKYISPADHRKIQERSSVAPGDILFAMIGSIGNPVVVDSDVEFSIKNVALFKPIARDLYSASFLRYFLTVSAEHMRDMSAGGVQSFVSLGFLRKYLMRLPPIAEQHRIVAKVDLLMALCDELEAKIETNQATARHFAEAVVAELAA